MMATIGLLAVVVALVSSVALTWRGVQWIRHGKGTAGDYLRWPVYGIVGGAIVAMTALEIAIMTDDFSVEYVANNSAEATPTLFKIAAGWAALEGSIVLWGLVLAGFVYTVYLQVARREDADRLGAGALAVLGLITAFFFGLMVTVSNPFRVCVELATVGCF